MVQKTIQVEHFPEFFILSITRKCKEMWGVFLEDGTRTFNPVALTNQDGSYRISDFSRKIS